MAEHLSAIKIIRRGIHCNFVLISIRRTSNEKRFDALMAYGYGRLKGTKGVRENIKEDRRPTRARRL